jgi:tetratricopeptide (TPR) repeat protein
MSERRRRGFLFVVGALATLILPNMLADLLRDSLQASGIVRVIGVVVTVLLVAGLVIDNRRWVTGRLQTLLGRRPNPAVPTVPPRVTALADQAEERLAELGTQAGGMASVEWFRASESELVGFVTGEWSNDELTPERVDDLARIADALDQWYVVERRGDALVRLGRSLEQIADRVDRYDLRELALVRVATGYRLAGEPDRAWEALGHSDGIAARGATSAAVRTRRQIEWALLHIDRAVPDLPADETEDALHNAHDRLDDASVSIPRADVAAEVALRIDLGVVALHRGDPERARQQLRSAASRAGQARDTSAHAHAVELMGVAAWLEGKAAEAVEWWRQADGMYAEVDETAGRIRCLAHLGTTGLADPAAAEALGGRAVARRCLDVSRALLRGTASRDDVRTAALADDHSSVLLRRLRWVLRGIDPNRTR